MMEGRRAGWVETFCAGERGGRISCTRLLLLMTVALLPTLYEAKRQGKGRYVVG
jgi:hypothetical protein